MNEEEIDLKELVKLFWKKKVFITVIVLIFIIIGFIYSLFLKNISYTSSAMIMFGRVENYIPQEGESQLLSEIQFNTSILGNYKNFIMSDDVLNTVISNLQLNEEMTIGDLKESIELNTSNGSLEIKVKSNQSELSQKIANELIKVFIEKSREFYQIRHTYSISQASESTTESNANHAIDLVCFTAVGVIVACGIVFCKYIFNPVIITEEDIESKFKLPVISSVVQKKDKKGNVIENIEVSEQFDVLRANIEFSLKDIKDKKTFFITSCNKSEGKTFVSTNLALAFSRIGKKVLVIDTDKKDGGLSKVFDVNNNYGLANYLTDSNKIAEKGKKTEDNLIKSTKYDGLDLVSIGSVNGKKFKIIQNKKFIKFIDEMKEKYDIVIFDGSEMVQYADSRFLANISDNTLLIACKNQTTESDLNNSIKEITKVKGNLIGILLNEIEKI